MKGSRAKAVEPRAETGDAVERHQSTPPEVASMPDDEPVSETHRRIDPDPDNVPLPAGPPRYRFLAEIASGGMGAVYRAHDTALNRDVAVKVLHERLAADGEAAQQFVDAARIAAQLQHPGIPAVSDLGTLADGRPFLVMKLIQGRTLAELFGEWPDPRRQRGQFVAAFEQVCQAVAYAHHRGVIHGDIEPTNVMVGAFGEVQVIDWGLAKVIVAGRASDGPGVTAPEPTTATQIRADREGDSETEAGSVMGTPAYMPPEQAIGAIDEIDARSDVFGLGAILCAILTGKPPYVSDTVESTRQMAARAKLDDALARLDACGAEPELIALCKWCMHPEKADRPADAGRVAQAVASLRAAAEDRARRAELERAAAEVEAREQRKRRRVLLALAVLSLAIVAGGSLVALRAERRAATERERVARNRDALVASLDRGEAALLAGDAAAAAPAVAEAAGRLPDGGGDEFRARVEQCQAELAFLQDLDRVNDLRWSSVGGRLPEPAAVADRWRATFAAHGIVPGATPPDEVARRVGDSLIADRLLAVLDLWLVAAPDPALAELLHAADREDYRDAIRTAIVKNEAQRLSDLAAQDAALIQPPRFAVAVGAMPQVGATRRRAVLQRVLADRPGDLGVLMGLGGTYPTNQRDGADERVRWYQAAAAAHPANTAAWNNLGVALHDRGQTADAITAYTRAVRLDPENHLALANLGIAVRDRGDVDDAIALYRRALWINPNTAITHYNLGIALRARNDVDGAIGAYREATRLDPKLAPAHYNLGIALAYKKDWKAAADAYREAIKVNPRYVDAHFGLGNVLWRLDDLDGAAAAYSEAIKLNPKFAPAHLGLGGVRLDRGDLDGAITAFREAAAIDPTNRLFQEQLDSALKQKADRDARIAPPPREVKQR